MANETKCKEWILSEEYRDFIINDNRTAFLENIAQNPACEQSAGFNYRCVYLPKLQAGSLNSKQFSYNSIPKCYAPLSMDTLNQAGILSIPVSYTHLMGGGTRFYPYHSRSLDEK